MIHSILQILVFQFLFLVGYDLFLKQESFFGLNRAYLLLSPVFGIVLPFISIDLIQQNLSPEFFVQMPAILVAKSVSEADGAVIAWPILLKSIWILGMLISTFVFSFKLYKILKLRSVGVSRNFEGVDFTILPNTDAAFSCFNKVYVGEKISKGNRRSIIAHEKVHVKQMHSLDLLYFEVLRIVLWFNPLVYLFQNRISVLHEYIADAEVVDHHNSKREYYQNLLSEVFQISEISFVNSFFKESLIKNRIIMLQKTKSPKIKLIKYLLLLPLIGVILTYTACSDASDNLEHDEQQITNLDLVSPTPPTPPIFPSQKSDEKNGDISFSVIEKVPVYPGCTGDNVALKICMSTKIAEFVNENFNTDVANDLNISGRQRISVQFKIDETGNVIDVQARARHPNIEEEAVRVVKALPKMQPAENKGEKVRVLYSLPIVFDVEE